MTEEERLLERAKEHCKAKEYDVAVKIFDDLARRGHVEAQCLLDNCFYFGLGVAHDYGKAVYWFTKAAEQGDEKAKQMLEEIRGY